MSGGRQRAIRTQQLWLLGLAVGERGDAQGELQGPRGALIESRGQLGPCHVGLALSMQLASEARFHPPPCIV